MFELGDIASSSSSSSASQSGHDDGCSSSGGDDHSVDEHLAEEIRKALHLAVGKTCRAEDNAERTTSIGDDDGSAASNSGSPTSSFAMSNEAIVALTDLTYHYTTSLLANDLVAFTKHAKRQIVKTDDVLLMVRKDKKGMLAELKRVMKDNPEVYEKEKPKARTGARAKPNKSTAAFRKRSTSPKANNNRGKGKGTKNKSNTNSRPLGFLTKDLSLSSSSSSSSSSGESSDDVLKARRKKLDLERQNLNKAKFAGKTAARKKTKEDDSDGSSSDDAEFEFGASASNKKKSHGKAKKKTQQPKKGRLKNGSFDLTDSNKSVGGKGRNTINKSAASFQLDGESEETEDNSMVIDLASD